MITLLWGDSFLVRRACHKTVAERLPSHLREFNWDRFEGREAEAAKIIGAILSLPAFAERRVVLVERADELKKGEIEKLEAALPGVPSSTDLIFTAAKIDKRLRFWQKVIEVAKVQEYRPLYPREVPGWIAQEARLIGKRLSPEATSLLVQSVGTEPGLLSAALEKLSLYVGTRAEITAEDVAACISGFSWKSVFELTEAAGEKDLNRSLKLLNGMIREGESLIALVALLARHFRILFRLKEKGEDRSVPPFFLKDYLRQAGRASAGELSRALERIFQADRDLKRSPLSDSLVMERLLWDLCRLRGDSVLPLTTPTE